MEQQENLLKDHSDREKGAYLGAIASLATADHSASDEEIKYIRSLAASADLSPEQEQAVVNAATELSGDELKKCLDILKTSDLRYSLVTDLIAFARSDSDYSEREQEGIKKVSDYLNIQPEQFSLLDQFVDKTKETAPDPEEVSKPGFLDSLGLGDKFKNAGLNMSTITKGLLGVAAPFILAKLFSGSGRSNRGSFGGLGNLGGMGNMMGRNSGYQSSGGGLGSVISMLSGGRGFGNTGGLLSKLFRL